MTSERVTELARELREALTQWTTEPLNTPRDKAGLTPCAANAMDLAGELCTELGAPSSFFGA